MIMGGAPRHCDATAFACARALVPVTVQSIVTALAAAIPVPINVVTVTFA